MMTSPVKDPDSRLYYAQKTLEGHWFSRKEYMDVFKNISSATASRDLKFARDHNILEKKGGKNQVIYYYFPEEM